MTGKKLTSLALRARFGSQHHIVAISRKTSRTVTHETTRKSFPSFHRLHGQILTHTIGNCIAVLSGFNALLRQMLYLRSSRRKLEMYFLLKERNHQPILKPYLNRTLCHVDFLGNAFTYNCCWGGVFVELGFQGHELFLRRSLTFLVLLLLCERALPRRPPRAI